MDEFYLLKYQLQVVILLLKQNAKIQVMVFWVVTQCSDVVGYQGGLSKH